MQIVCSTAKIAKNNCHTKLCNENKLLGGISLVVHLDNFVQNHLIYNKIVEVIEFI